MARILSHPFRLASNSAVATVDQDSAVADAEQIAVLALTRPGERPLAPGFGVTDPVYTGFNPAELTAGVAVYGPPVTIRQVTAEPVSDVEQRVQIDFE